MDFDFPVTALIGTNGSGKSTVLGASAIAYRHMRPATFFPKSSLGDDSMSNWSIAYDIIDKSKSQAQISRHYRFKNFRWVRDDLVERPVAHFGIKRTVPAGERPEFKRLASVRYKYTGIRNYIAATVREHASRILGKDITYFKQAHPSEAQAFYVGGDGDISYSEFHFGAGESSIIRMVTDIEIAPDNTLVLIEEIENGLHPIATRRMVEYLIDVAHRRSIQSIFTTHSEDALLPLPTDSIWYSISGKLRQGRISIEALRSLSDKIEETLAVIMYIQILRRWL